MLDSDLEKLYGIGTKVLKQDVRKNIPRFPDDLILIA
ncbi:ORF6N domain-containing protein [Sphingobacterium anhuiense]|uniref:ORF6N domain-containing protein n=1 Tax=Sphingobacterium anhuiense TaxID=493780 RepID=A0ABW5Z0D5_9SPHI